MTCTHINQLLPLFVGGDLSLQKADSVRAHLFACQDCSSAAAEFEASQSWLASSKQPDFDDQFYENLRDSVWREVRKEQRRTEPRAASRVPGWTWLVATAMVALLFAGFLFAKRNSVQPEPREIVQVFTAPPLTDLRPIDAPPSVVRRGTRTKSLASRSRRLPQMQSAKNRLMPPAAGVAMAPRVGVAVETGPVLRRMEIQTSDPTVRIIWLVADESTKALVDLDIYE